MGLASRFIRLWKADLHGVLESIEDRGLLLKQCLREMEDELESREVELHTLIKKKEEIGQDREILTREAVKVENDLEAAVRMDKDDISRFLIRKKLLLDRRQKELARHIQRLEQEIMNAREAAAGRRTQYQEIRLRAAEFFRSAQNREREHLFAEIMPATDQCQPSDEEVEIELIRRKNNLTSEGKEANHE